MQMSECPGFCLLDLPSRTGLLNFVPGLSSVLFLTIVLGRGSHPFDRWGCGPTPVSVQGLGSWEAVSRGLILRNSEAWSSGREREAEGQGQGHGVEGVGWGGLDLEGSGLEGGGRQD